MVSFAERIASLEDNDKPPVPTKQDLENLRHFMSDPLSPGGNRYGGYSATENKEAASLYGKFNRYIQWKYRLSGAESERLARWALIESLLPSIEKDFLE